MLENEVGELLPVQQVAAELVVFTDKGQPLKPEDVYSVTTTQDGVSSAERGFRVHVDSPEDLKRFPFDNLLILAATESSVLKHLSHAQLRAALAKGALEEIQSIGEAIIKGRLGEMRTGNILSSHAEIVSSNSFPARRRNTAQLESRKQSLEDFITKLTVYQSPSSPRPAASPMRK